MVKPLPDKLAPLTMTAAVPLDVKVTGWIDGVPTATLPKATALELTVRAAAPATGGTAAMPVPVICTVVDGLAGELLAMTNCAEAAPAAEGPKWTLRVVVLLAATVYGSVPAPS
jgi:hypothetical protein